MTAPNAPKDGLLRHKGTLARILIVSLLIIGISWLAWFSPWARVHHPVRIETGR
ncbi:MAG: hypothetical protein KGJ62_07490 [Armatimonadetes bacterium]|nr:hypothetical protein [Armatimonadota bacterium]MDE2207472.1 hypothetical protein [Armatimonadota bacterium]